MHRKKQNLKLKKRELWDQFKRPKMMQLESRAGMGGGTAEEKGKKHLK